jgi:hypothetical protein
MWLAQNGMQDPNHAGAGAVPYMHLMGLVTLGWMWLKMADVSSRLENAPGEDASFHQTKLATARFYAQRELPKASAYRGQIEAGGDTLMALAEEAF